MTLTWRTIWLGHLMRICIGHQLSSAIWSKNHCAHKHIDHKHSITQQHCWYRVCARVCVSRMCACVCVTSQAAWLLLNCLVKSSIHCSIVGWEKKEWKVNLQEQKTIIKHYRTCHQSSLVNYNRRTIENNRREVKSFSPFLWSGWMSPEQTMCWAVREREENDSIMNLTIPLWTIAQNDSSESIDASWVGVVLL